MSDPSLADSGPAEPCWRPLSSIERRVVGVLVEKAKTTPEQYPLTLNALRTGSNQKSNRFPLMDLDTDRIEDALERLRELGAVVEIQGSGRALKFRHRMYEWLGVEKVELAVMTELLLRGAQTVGELRGRAARMDPIADLAALRPILTSLLQKNLIVYLTPEGRGCVVTHNLYAPKELERLRAEHNGSDIPTSSSTDRPTADPPAETHSPQSVRTAPAAPTAELERLTDQIQGLHSELAESREKHAELKQLVDQLRSEIDDLKQQLGV